MNDLERKIFNLGLPICEGADVELVKVEIVKENGLKILRLLIDSPKGISIDDVTVVSGALSAKLDEEDPIPDKYYLEVSSLGIERELATIDDIKSAIGKYIAIKTYEKINGTKEFEGTLLNFDGETITILAKVKQFKKEILIPYHLVAKIRLAIEF